MSHENPELISPKPPDPHQAIQPDAADFRDTPDVEPLSVEHQRFPLWLFIACGVALFLAGSSFTGFQVFGRGQLDQGPGTTLESSAGLTQAAGPETPADQGKKVYGQVCANCHQGSGMGQPGSYPPLAGSDYVTGSPERLAAILLKGLQGPITVNGGQFGTQVMPAQETSLTPEKIADLMTYLRSAWGNKAGPVEVAVVNAAKTKYASKTSAFTEAELQQIK
ncbi:MAG: cytochrome c [Verrucomicrobiota bacterium]